jgi:hypothetical protein
MVATKRGVLISHSLDKTPDIPWVHEITINNNKGAIFACWKIVAVSHTSKDVSTSGSSGFAAAFLKFLLPATLQSPDNSLIILVGLENTGVAVVVSLFLHLYSLK